MTDTQLIIAVCVLWTINGFALGAAAMWAYIERQDRKLNGEME